MNKFLFSLFVLFLISNHYTIAQMNKSGYSELREDFYRIEAEGYISAPINTPYGLLYTNNSKNAIYLYKNGKSMAIANTQGSGRYFSVSPDLSKVGYKKIDQEGQQLPAIVNLSDLSETIFPVNSKLCSQISFSDKGDVVYASENQLYIYNNEDFVRMIPVNNYSNMPVISPDGKHIVFNNEKDQLIVIDTEGRQLDIITYFSSKGFGFSKWSPDSKKVLFQSFDGNMYVHNIDTDIFSELGKGASPVWYNNYLVIYQEMSISETEQMLNASEIAVYDYYEGLKTNLTSTSAIFEMNPSISGNKILYHTYKGNQIYEVDFEYGNNEYHIGTPNLLYSATKNDLYKKTNKNKLATSSTNLYIPNVPYTHQVYDSPDWHGGSGSCGPACASMILAQYNVVPKWSNTVCCPYSHNSNYGFYIASEYMFDEYSYDNTALDANYNPSWGSYGFIWGYGSPYSYFDEYFNRHGLSSDTAIPGDNYQSTLAELNQGYPHLICNYLTSVGHIIVATGAIHPQRTVISNDPYGNKNTPSWPSYDGKDSYYDWPGYNNGYENMDGGYVYGGIAWTTKVHGQQKSYNDTIIDDLAFNNGFYMHNEYPSDMKYFRDVSSDGYQGHFWWTYSMASTSDICYTTWSPDLAYQGKYEVMAYIPTTNVDAAKAHYKIEHALGVTLKTINQAANSGKWVTLGEYYFNSGNNGYVYLGDSTGINNERIAFDAVKWKLKSIVTDITHETIGIFKVNLYPNPVYDRLMINIQTFMQKNELKISIFNSIGQQVYFSEFQSSVSSIVISEISSLREGIYKLVVEQGNKKVIETFVKN